PPTSTRFPYTTLFRSERRVRIPEPQRARAAAMLITAAEGANLHLADLRTRAKDFDPMTRDRFLGNALLPAALYVQAQRFRAWYQIGRAHVFRTVDVILAPTTPYAAPEIGAPRTRRADGAAVLTRSHIGVCT